MNAGHTFTTKHNRFLMLMLALGLALTMFAGQNKWGRLIGIEQAVIYACQGPGSNC